jgi:hypothetical protein
MPDVPAETVTVDGETEREKLLDEFVDAELEQPESAKPNATIVRRQQRLRTCGERLPTKSARRSPNTPKVDAFVVRMVFEESFVVLRKEWIFPALICALEQLDEPV